MHKRKVKERSSYSSSPKNIAHHGLFHTIKHLHIFVKLGFFVFLVVIAAFTITHISISKLVHASGSVEPYSSPNAKPSIAYSLTANGQTVPVEEFNGVSYARFATSGNVPVVVTANQAITSSTLSPKRYNISTQVSGKTISFTLSQPEKLILNVNNGENLLIFADPLEINPPQLGQANVVNVMNYVTDNTGATLQKTQIQNAINAVSQLNNGTGGILYFPNGTYKTGCLLVKSNVTIYLQSGAILQGSANYSDYCNNDTTQPFFLGFDGVTNAKIIGRGIIDGAGTSIRNTTDGSNAVFTVETLNNAHNIHLEDVLLRNNASWAVHILQSNAVTASNIKVVNPMNIFYLDGIDPDGSSNVTIDGELVYTTDDCNSVKTSTGYYQVEPVPLPQANNIVIQNGVCYTKSSGFKVGSEINATATNVTYQDNTIVNAGHAFFMVNEFNSNAAAIDGITIANNYTESGVAKLSDFRVGTRTTVVGTINNITINGLWADTFGDPQNPLDTDANYSPYWWFETVPDELVMGPDPGHTIGGATYPNQISNITYSNMYVAGTPIESTGAAKFMYQFTNNNSVSFVSAPLLSTPTPTPSPTTIPTATPTPTPTLVPYYNQVLNDGAVSYFRLADTKTTTAANVKGTPAGKYINGPKYSQQGALTKSGDLNSSVLFNGTNQYIDIPYSTTLSSTGSFSVEAWVYLIGGTGAYRGIVASRYYPEGYVIYASRANQWSFWINSGSTMATVNGPTVALNNWTQVVATYDSSTKKATLYINGASVGSTAISSYTRNSQQDEAIGQGEPGSNFFTPGRIDEVSFYNTALTATQVAKHYHAAGY